MSDLYKRSTYLTDIPLIINGSIYEYDLSKANISVLYAYDYLTYDEYINLYNLEKTAREIAIGRRMRDESNEYNNSGKQMALIIKNGIIEAKRQLFEANNIQDESIIRIANDAVYVNGPLCPITEFDLNNNGRPVVFKCKSFYNIMVNLNKVSVFINDEQFGDSYNIDVKGIKDEKLYLHEAFIEFICETITGLSRSGKETALYQFNSFYESYINMQLPIEYYREFNADSGYRIKGSNYIVEILDERYKDMIDISYNLNLLRHLYSIILGNLG